LLTVGSIQVKFSEFVEEHLGARPGPLIEAETGAVVGAHKGFWFHTVGQRQGLGLGGGPWYVVAKDSGRNLVYISRRYHEEGEGAGRRNAFRVGGFSWLGDARPAQGAQAGTRLKVRHGARLYAASLAWETPAQAAAAEAAGAAAADERFAALQEAKLSNKQKKRALLRPPELATPAAAAAAAEAEAADAAPRPVPPQPAPPPPPGLTARVVLDGNDQGLAVRPSFFAPPCARACADAHASCAGGAVRSVLRR